MMSNSSAAFRTLRSVCPIYRRERRSPTFSSHYLPHSFCTGSFRVLPPRSEPPIPCVLNSNHAGEACFDLIFSSCHCTYPRPITSTRYQISDYKAGARPSRRIARSDVSATSRPKRRSGRCTSKQCCRPLIVQCHLPAVRNELRNRLYSSQV